MAVGMERFVSSSNNVSSIKRFDSLFTISWKEVGAKIRSWLLIADSSYSGINNKYLEYVQNNESNIWRWKNQVCFIWLITLRFSFSFSLFLSFVVRLRKSSNCRIRIIYKTIRFMNLNDLCKIRFLKSIFNNFVSKR